MHNTLSTTKLSFLTFHSQFWLKDFSANDPSGTFWNDNSVSDRMAQSSGVLGISVRTDCFSDLLVEIRILDHQENNTLFDSYDHFVESGIEITSGKLLVWPIPLAKEELSIDLNPGIYRVRVYSSGIKEEYKDLNQEGCNGQYLIEIWPGSSTETMVLKRLKY